MWAKNNNYYNWASLTIIKVRLIFLTDAGTMSGIIWWKQLILTQLAK